MTKSMRKRTRKDKKEKKKKAAKDKKNKKEKKEQKDTKDKKELQNRNVKLAGAFNIWHEATQISDQEPVVVPARMTTLGALREELQRSGLTKTLKHIRHERKLFSKEDQICNEQEWQSAKK